MCEDWRPRFFDKYTCEGSYVYAGDGEILIEGKLKENIPNTNIFFWAPCPPDYRQSYSGSGLPFANPQMAFENTPNTGNVFADKNGFFRFRIRLPNSYYVGLGTVYRPPQVQIRVRNEKRDSTHTIDLGDGIPFRMLTYPPPPNTAPRCSPLFYNQRYKLPDARTQEQILRDSGFPKTNKMPANFWGLAIPQA